jgi:hypothetical protein
MKISSDAIERNNGFTALAQINAAALTTSAMLWMNVTISGYRENPNKWDLRLDGQRPNFAKLRELLRPAQPSQRGHK